MTRIYDKAFNDDAYDRSIEEYNFIKDMEEPDDDEVVDATYGADEDDTDEDDDLDWDSDVSDEEDDIDSDDFQDDEDDFDEEE